MARRIQRSRAKGWRMPEGAVYVGRPSQWGNPFRATDADLPWCGQSLKATDHGLDLDTMGAAGAAYHFRPVAVDHMLRDPDWLAPLRGRDLVCWCPLDQPCHADVLLELANS